MGKDLDMHVLTYPKSPQGSHALYKCGQGCDLRISYVTNTKGISKVGLPFGGGGSRRAGSLPSLFFPGTTRSLLPCYSAVPSPTFCCGQPRPANLTGHHSAPACLIEGLLLPTHKIGITQNRDHKFVRSFGQRLGLPARKSAGNLGGV